MSVIVRAHQIVEWTFAKIVWNGNFQTKIKQRRHSEYIEYIKTAKIQCLQATS